MKLKTQNSRFHSARTTAAFSASIPTQAGGNDIILRDVRIVEEGQAKGHGVWMDANFIKETVRLAEGRRIKSRLGHTNMCKESLGTYIGYYDNFRVIEGELGAYAIADLHLSNAAKKSPNGDITTYISELAKEAPDMFGNSIEFVPSLPYYKTEKGIKVYELAWYYWDEVEEEYRLLETEEPYNKELHGDILTDKCYVDIMELCASDLVDQPAATSSLFSESHLPSLVQQVMEVFGVKFGNKRKVIMLKKLIENNMKLDINAKTTAGTEIVVVTENSYIGVGDSVMVGDQPAQDGAHNIAESDSNQSGITITTSGGVITKIEPTEIASPPVSAGSDTAPTSEYQQAITELSQKHDEIITKISQLAEKSEIFAKQLAAMEADFEKFKDKPAADRTPNIHHPLGHNPAAPRYISPITGD